MFYNIQQQEEADYEMNAQADYMSEAFGEEARMLNAQARWEHEAEEALRANDAMDAMETRGGPAPVEHHAPLSYDDIPF